MKSWPALLVSLFVLFSCVSDAERAKYGCDPSVPPEQRASLAKMSIYFPHFVQVISVEKKPSSVCVRWAGEFYGKIYLSEGSHEAILSYMRQGIFGIGSRIYNQAVNFVAKPGRKYTPEAEYSESVIKFWIEDEASKKIAGILTLRIISKKSR